MSDPLQPAEGQCAFYLPKKKRFCRFRPNQGQKYCPEHACVLGVVLERKRILCPLNPKHTCYEDNLDKHLKKCNSRKRRIEEYYEEGINAGSEDGESMANMQTAVKATDTERLKQIIEKVNRLYKEHIGTVEEDIHSHDCLRQEMDNPYFGLSALRHRRQQASLIGQLEELGLLAPGHCYVEMGAGKGQLSHWVRQAVSAHDDAAFLLVDRSSIRYKMDCYHKEEEKVKFERIKMDIEHLRLGKVPMVANSQRPLVAIGKHLCGAATDLTLRCLMETLDSGSLDADSSEPSPKRSRTEITSATSADSSGSLDADSSEPSPKRSRTEITSATSADSVEAAPPQCEGATSTPSSSTSCSEEDRLQRSSSDSKTVSDDTKCAREETQKGVEKIRGVATEEEVKTGVDVEEVAGQEDRSSACHPSGLKTGGGRNVVTDKRVAGVLIALCCHHRCTWRAYVGKPFMRQCGISAADFHLLTRLTSWAVCGWRGRDGSFGTKETSQTSTPVQDSKTDTSTADQSVEQTSSQKVDSSTAEEEREHDTADLVSDTDKVDGLQLTEKQKETIGWRCKRLLDYGRVCYLRDQGLLASLKIYIDAQQTPENVVLVAKPAANN